MSTKSTVTVQGIRWGRRFEARPFEKTFKSSEQLEKWLDKHDDVEIQRYSFD